MKPVEFENELCFLPHQNKLLRDLWGTKFVSGNLTDVKLIQPWSVFDLGGIQTHAGIGLTRLYLVCSNSWAAKQRQVVYGYFNYELVTNDIIIVNDKRLRITGSIVIDVLPILIINIIAIRICITVMRMIIIMISIRIDVIIIIWLTIIIIRINFYAIRTTLSSLFEASN